MTLEDEPPTGRLSNELLKKALPKYADLFGEEYRPELFDRTVAAARAVLSEAAKAEPEHAALLLVAAEALANQLANMGADHRTDRAGRVRKALAPFGIRIGEPTHLRRTRVQVGAAVEGCRVLQSLLHDCSSFAG